MITQELTETIAQQLTEMGISEQGVSQLRQQYPNIHFTYCLDDEINLQGQPVLENPAFNVYLVNGHNHCFCLTRDYEAATGLVFAEILEEDN